MNSKLKIAVGAIVLLTVTGPLMAEVNFTKLVRNISHIIPLVFQVKKNARFMIYEAWKNVNSERTKKYWVEYLEECVDIVGIWVCAFIFKMTVDKYVKKKMEYYYDQQERERRMKPKEV